MFVRYDRIFILMTILLIAHTWLTAKAVDGTRYCATAMRELADAVKTQD